MSDNATASPAVATATPVTAPAPVSSAPVVPATPAAPQDSFDSAQEFIDASPKDLAARYGLTLNDTSFDAPAEPEVAATPTPEPPPAAPAAATPEPVAPSAPAIEPITKFELYDEQGAYEIPMNVKLSFPADGKEYKDLRLDEVVRMAQRAPLAEKHRAEADQLRPLAERTQSVEQAYQQLANEFAQNNALYEQLLANPALYQEAAQQYAQHNTPEQRLARTQQQMQAREQQFQTQLQTVALQQATTAAASYTATRIAPRVDALTTQYPAIDAGDVMAKFHELTAPLLAPSPSGGVWVPPNRVTELESSVLPQLESWAQAKSAKVSASSQAATAAAAKEVQKAQLDAQLAKRQLTRPLTPAGTPPAADVPRPKPIKSATDAIEASLERARSQIRGAA